MVVWLSFVWNSMKTQSLEGTLTKAQTILGGGRDGRDELAASRGDRM